MKQRLESEHHARLRKIRLKCIQCRDNAKNRTPGRWEASPNYLIGGYWLQDARAKEREGSVADCFSEIDADFIDDCSAAAESGWETTIGLIDMYFESTTMPNRLAWMIIDAWKDVDLEDVMEWARKRQQGE